MKNIILCTLIFISFAFSQREDVLDVTSINADNNTYNLDQMMSINMEDSDIKNVLMLIVKLGKLKT